MSFITTDDIPPLGKVCFGPVGKVQTDLRDVEIMTLKSQIVILESALYAALRLRGLGEAYHDNLALIGERRKYTEKMNDIETQIRDALNMKTEGKSK